MYIGLHVKYPLFLSDFNETRNFSTDFQKNTQISNFTKIRLVGAELFHAPRYTGFLSGAFAKLQKVTISSVMSVRTNSHFLQFCEGV